jgi:hypothetical protein
MTEGEPLFIYREGPGTFEVLHSYFPPLIALLLLLHEKTNSQFTILGRSVADKHHFNADPDPDPPFYLNSVLTSHFDADPDPDPNPYQVMRICDHWSTDPPQLHFEPLRLHCERSRPSMVQFSASKAPEV